MILPDAAFKIAMDWDGPEPQRKISAQTGGTSDSGLPLGGLGTGGMVFSRTGRFTRWTINPQQVLHHREAAAGFALWQQEAGQDPKSFMLQPDPNDGSLSAASWREENAKNQYAALFPKAWHDYAGCPGPVKARCESFSPLVPDDLETSALPVAIFKWTLENTSTAPMSAALMFQFPNLVGAFRECGKPYRRHAGCFNTPVHSDTAHSIVFDRQTAASSPDSPPDMGEGQMAISIANDGNLLLTECATFDAASDGSDFWPGFSKSGTLDPSVDWIADAGFREVETNRPAGALAAKCELAPGESRTITFALSWDLPTIRFGSGRHHARKYTKHWGCEGNNALAMVEQALSCAPDWSQRIDAWHDSMIARLGDSPSVTGMMLNELYFLVDGMTVYTAESEADNGHFGIIECPDYPYYNTLDLWIYASEAVLSLWPQAARLVMEDFARSVLQKDDRQRRHMRSKASFPVKRAGALPHDQGCPDEDPFFVNNGYAWQDSTQWKDLNSQFLIGFVRDGRKFGAHWLAAHWDEARAACLHLNQYDRDGDGLIENDGFPDQTFDNIPMKGPSAYCGGLWIAALFAMAEAAHRVGDTSAGKTYCDQAKSAREALEAALWTGTHYRLDRDGPFSECLLIEQLFGAFLARRYGFDNVVPDKHAILALKTLYRENFQIAGRGEGAITLANMLPAAIQAVQDDHHIAFQTSECIVGFNFSFAAQLECWGLRHEGQKIRKALYRNLYQRGMFARTPAAYDVAGMEKGLKFRATMNMRPLAVWFASPWDFRQPDQAMLKR
ncbi:GH116 family glycosyl hydrolase [Pararhizobium sp. IMCC21322]|uniref:GH116 family glycosyl hydrolase n=1 Tax=Pararhizobium sp. IMCC21322 TaxID=3067903 RepID=UPI00274145D7|nr:GH116 family glycosyl hydrolase [Pararhizobium sp. IMCC21322]